VADQESNSQFSCKDHSPKIRGSADQGSLRRAAFGEGLPDRHTVGDDIDLIFFRAEKRPHNLTQSIIVLDNQNPMTVAGGGSDIGMFRVAANVAVAISFASSAGLLDAQGSGRCFMEDFFATDRLTNCFSGSGQA
jgi:hypothetical protein